MRWTGRKKIIYDNAGLPNTVRRFDFKLIQSIDLPVLAVCHHINSFLNCRKRCHGAYSYGNALPFHKGYCQRQCKQKQPRYFVHYRMQSYELFFPHISLYDIPDFDHRNHTAPYPQPPRNRNCRQQLKQRRRCKNKVGNCVQLASKPAGAVCFSGDCPIYHITKTAHEICDIEFYGKSRKEQQQNAAENTTTRKYICNMLRHLFTRKLGLV